MEHVLINNKKLCFEIKGTGYPLLFGHSYLWDHKMWCHQTDLLSKNYTCINVDLLGIKEIKGMKAGKNND